MSDIDQEVTDVVMSSMVERLAELRAAGHRPDTVHVSSETIEHVARHVLRDGVPTPHARRTLFGLWLETDDSLGLGMVRVEERTGGRTA